MKQFPKRKRVGKVERSLFPNQFFYFSFGLFLHLSIHSIYLLSYAFKIYAKSKFSSQIAINQMGGKKNPWNISSRKTFSLVILIYSSACITKLRKQKKAKKLFSTKTIWRCLISLLTLSFLSFINIYKFKNKNN